MKTKATENTLTRWTRPAYYIGAEWADYYLSGVGQSRDSSPLERANFDAMLKAIGGEKTSDMEDPNDPGAALSLVRVVRENHWAVGWVEWIAIHESNTEALLIASGINEDLENYPVIDEELWSRYEQEEAEQVWRDCYGAQERLEYVRKHRSQFEFQSLADMLGCIRGKYFAGYASDLVAG